MNSTGSIVCVVMSCAALFGLSSPASGQSPVPPVDTLWATVHNHRIAFYAAGDIGSPSVVLEPGGGSHQAWGGFASEIAKFARVVTYDRPGYGQSEACSRVRSASVIAEELHEALSILGIKPPYVLGGWSLGGSFVRVFGAMYPDAVAGLVLIDPAPDNFYDRAAREQPDKWYPMLEEQNRQVATREEGVRAEWAAWDATMSETRASDAELKVPVILLTATKDEDGLQSIWIDEHRRWAASLPNVRHVLVEDAGHAIYRDKPESVLQAMRRVLAEVGR
jgi:pimeloyl-ACP methyl ester carboxylesterase